MRLNYWEEWCLETNAFRKYRSVEDYAKAKLGIKDLDDQLVGSTAIAATKDDEVAPARELAKFKNDKKRNL